MPFLNSDNQGRAESHFSDSDSAPAPLFKTSAPTPKNLKHQLRLLLALRKLPTNLYWKVTVYFASWGKTYVMTILSLIEHIWLKWSR